MNSRTPEFPTYNGGVFYRAARILLLSLVATHCLAAQHASIPFYFEKNRGQLGPSVSYLARDSQSIGLFEPHHVLWQSGESRQGLMRMSFENPDRSSVIEGLDALSGKVNYIAGSNSRTWIRHVECYSRIRYRNIFPGVNVDFRGASGAIEYDIVVNPGADPARVRLIFSGARSSRLTDSGDLVFETAGGPVRHHAPISWQVIDGERRAVTVRFVTFRHGPDTGVGFSIDSWDRTAPLTIDPVVSYDQTIGGSGIINALSRIQVDGQGNVYVVGLTSSLDLPVTTGPKPSGPGIQPFAAKLKADGSFAYITYFAPGTSGAVTSLSIDSAGDAWMAGSTASANFPVTPNAFQKTFNGGLCAVTGNPNATCTDGFIFALNPSGDAPVYGTFLGGSGTDLIDGIRIAADGTIWAAGTTSSADFPVTSSAIQSKLNGPQDAFLTHLDPRSPTLLYSTYFGGSGYETATGIAVDSQGAVYIGGATDSTDFPVTTGALQPAYGGGTDVFFAKFAGTTQKPVFATYWGGLNGDLLNALAADSAGNLYAAVVTSQSPITLGSGFIFVNNPRASLMKIDPTGKVVWSNQSLSIVQAIAVDSQGRLSALGQAFPRPVLTPNALNTCPGLAGTLLLQLEADGKTVRYGSGVTAGDFALDSSGSVYLASGTLIEKQDFSQDPPMAATCILGATERDGDAVAPGEIISIYGRNIGPVQGVIGAFDSSGRLPLTLGGVSVTFNGAPAPLWYAQAGQINAIVPFKVVGEKSASVQVTSNGAAAPLVRVDLRDASNLIAGVNNLIAAINEDGTINSNDHPAKPGSIVAIFSSGGGQTNPPSIDGQIVNAALPLVLPVKVLVGSGLPLTPAEVLYAGSAPGLVAGTVQINFRVPLNLPPSVIGPGNPNQNVAIIIGGDQVSFSTSGAIFVR